MLNSLAVLMLLYVLWLQRKQIFGLRRQQEERQGRRTKPNGRSPGSAGVAVEV